jgi:hypothetical protein
MQQRRNPKGYRHVAGERGLILVRYESSYLMHPLTVIRAGMPEKLPGGSLRAISRTAGVPERHLLHATEPLKSFRSDNRLLDVGADGNKLREA